MLAARRTVPLFVLLAKLLPGTLGHGLLEFPPLRGGIGGSDLNQWCPHCGNGGSVCGDGGQWGASSNFLGRPESPKATFKAGETVEFQVRITAHHRGHFEFSICDQVLSRSSLDPEGCLSKHKLRRASPPSDCVPNDSRGDCQPVHDKYPERWYLPPGTGLHKMRFVIPAGLQCTACTLQWRWWSANSCVPAPDYGCYFAQMRSKGWSADTWCGSFCGSCGSSLLQGNASSAAAAGCGEEFRNCADIAVLPGVAASPAPSPVPTPAPTPAPTPTPGTSAPTTSVPSAGCVPVFDCGMHSWCDQQGFARFCAARGASGTCASSFCKATAAEPEPEPEAEPAPTVALLEARVPCHPLLPEHRRYCADLGAEGRCPKPHCTSEPAKVMRARGREHSFLGLLQTSGVLDRAAAAAAAGVEEL